MDEEYSVSVHGSWCARCSVLGVVGFSLSLQSILCGLGFQKAKKKGRRCMAAWLAWFSLAVLDWYLVLVVGSSEENY